jgi:uncharacterized membrane protein
MSACHLDRLHPIEHTVIDIVVTSVIGDMLIHLASVHDVQELPTPTDTYTELMVTELAPSVLVSTVLCLVDIEPTSSVALSVHLRG